MVAGRRLIDTWHSLSPQVYREGLNEIITLRGSNFKLVEWCRFLHLTSAFDKWITHSLGTSGCESAEAEEVFIRNRRFRSMAPLDIQLFVLLAIPLAGIE